MKKKLGKHLTVVLKKMCQIVGADYSKIDFLKTNWFYEYSWSQCQERRFQKWFIGYLRKNGEARREFTGLGHSVSKRVIEETVHAFNFNYGWKSREIQKDSLT